MSRVFRNCRIGFRHVLYYNTCFAMLREFRPSLVWTRQVCPLLRVKLTTTGPVPVSPEAGPAWA